MAVIVTLTTDFGVQDTFVGQMKGVILGQAPGAAVVDLTHAIQPQDVQGGALALVSGLGAFPAGTVHLAVVDPGVGSTRRAVAVEASTPAGLVWLVGPDNGVLSLSWRDGRAVRAFELNNPEQQRPRASQTFHGRDVFAPAAGWLAAGGAPEALGSAWPVDQLVRLDLPAPQPVAEGLVLQVIDVDRFGNLVTNLSNDGFDAWRGATPASAVVFEAGAVRVVGVASTFADVAEGELLAYPGSAGWIELAVRNGAASERLEAARGGLIFLRRLNP